MQRKNTNNLRYIYVLGTLYERLIKFFQDRLTMNPHKV